MTKQKNYAYRVNPATGEKRSSSVERKTVRAYVQDKIHLTDKWDLTPSLRYSHYSDYKESTGGNGAGNTNDFNYSLNTEYMFNDKVGMYLGWTKGFRPLRQGIIQRRTMYSMHRWKTKKGIYILSAFIMISVTERRWRSITIGQR